MNGKKEQKDNGAKSSWSLGKIEKLFDKQIKLAKTEFSFLHAASLITPECEKAFREATIDVDVLKKLPKEGQQEDKALKEEERERRCELKRDCIRKFLEIGRELKKSEPESKLFNLSVELLDYLDRIESDLHSLSGYEWRKLDTLLNTYGSLLRGEAKKGCKEASAEKPTKTKQDITPTKWRRIKACLKKVVENTWQIFTKSFWETVFDRFFGPQ
jgi:hypothetical protein